MRGYNYNIGRNISRRWTFFEFAQAAIFFIAQTLFYFRICAGSGVASSGANSNLCRTLGPIFYLHDFIELTAN